MSRGKKALTLSIIIPAYNEEDYLEACLNSIAAQSHQPQEVIVIDNNSTDATVAIAKKFPFVKLLSEKKQGAAFARDKGFNAAKSDLIGRIDADTRLPSDWAYTVFGMFEKDQEMAAVSGPAGFYDLPLRRLNLLADKVVRTTLYYIGFKEERYLFGSNMALRRNAWIAVADKVCHDYGLHEDNDLAIHLTQEGFEVHYSNKLVADISARRADSPLRDTLKYCFMEYRTFRHHGILSLQSITAALTLLTLYFPLRLVYRLYDQEKSTLSLRKFFVSRRKPRKLPMD